MMLSLETVLIKVKPLMLLERSLLALVKESLV
jgi:hypothetical protein